MMRAATIRRVSLCAALAFAWMPQGVLAQQQSVPNALQGFSQNKDQPVKIEAASLEVRDKEKIATFSGSVIVTQGDTTMRCKSLVVHYDAESKSSGMKTAQPGPGGSSSIKKLEALGGVLVTQKEQTATGDKGLFDMKSNSITLSGNVLITQGQNVLRGERLVVDVATGAARVEGGRVSGVFVPSSADDKKDKDKDKEKAKDSGKDKDAAKPKETPKEAAKLKEAPKAKEPAKTQEEAAPASRPAAREPAARETVAVPERAPIVRDNYAPERAPAARDAGATPERSKPVAPRGIY
jgi:lipopolysaccharide export system protein LptA